jgi:phosphonopyruvate decarboxylase
VRSERRVVVLDGDGAALMRLGALATIGTERQANLLHVLLDNEAHESTGGQGTVADRCDLGAVARVCGYARVERARSSAELEAAVACDTQTLRFVHVKVAASDATPPRPALGPVEAATRLRRWLDTAPAT